MTRNRSEFPIGARLVLVALLMPACADRGETELLCGDAPCDERDARADQSGLAEDAIDEATGRCAGDAVPTYPELRCAPAEFCECAEGYAGEGCDVVVPEGYVLILPGTFVMGSPATEPGHLPDEYAHPVTLTRPFLLKRTEVTQGEWESLADDNASWHGCTDKCPVEKVDWYSAVAFANAMSVAEGLEPCYDITGCADPERGWHNGAWAGCSAATFVGESCLGYRLPTEAEWEYAARAGDDRETWGGAVALEGCEDCVAARVGWYCGNSGHHPHEVGQRTNPWGLQDMLGNVWEWTNDWYGLYPADATDPVGASQGRFRSVRGGGYGDSAPGLRAARRGLNEPWERFPYLGFRLARWVE